MNFAYADPPYIGQAKRHYSHDPRCAEVDHVELVERLRGYDGWALSCSSPSLEEILHICRAVIGPNSVRVGGWFKPFAAFKPNVNPGYTWEPVVFVPSPRKRLRTERTVRDYIEADAVRANITLRKGLSGAKPEAFCQWIIELLGIQIGDTLDDLFPGTGIMGREWTKWYAAKMHTACPNCLGLGKFCAACAA